MPMENYKDKTVWVTSDLHLGHDKDFLYLPRGFRTIEEHDEKIIKNINSIIARDDELFILGDLILNNTEAGIELIKQIQCDNIHIIRGNHDTDNRIEAYLKCDNIQSVDNSLYIKYGKYRFYLSHYPTLTGNYDEKGLKQKLINLCGHTHTKDYLKDIEYGPIYHCELDAHDNQLVLLDNIIIDLRRFYGQSEN